jgi:glycosyltransferase involved in cell wall biosynthesis
LGPVSIVVPFVSVALTIVIPVYNEEANIDSLLEQIARALPGLPSPAEVIIVDDGSGDTTVPKSIIAKKKYPWLKIIELRRNFGQHAATYAGFDHAKGGIVVTLDGDLQNNPADIAKLLEKMAEGYDIVCGWRMERRDPFFSRRLPSLITNHLIRNDAPTLIHDYGCFLRAYTNTAAKEISHYSTSRGWFPVLFSKLGFKVGEVVVSHRERPGGEGSKHGFFVRLDQFMSVFMGATTKPFQFVEVIGIGALGLGGVGLLYGVFTRSWQLGVLSVSLALWGFSVTITGMVGEYLVRMNYEMGRKPKYLVRNVHE